MPDLERARAVAEAFERQTPGASDAYRAARTNLLEAEIELRRHMEAVAAQRRALPPGPEMREDYVLNGLLPNGKSGTVRLSELFRDGTDTLVVYSYMFPRHRQDTRPAATSGETGKLGQDDQPCPSCTALLDQLDGAALHFEAMGGNFAVVADTALPNLLAVARDRGWKNLRLLSSGGTNFKRDTNSLGDDGQQAPMTLVFKREADGKIRLTWASDLVWIEADPGQDHRAAGTIEPFWNMFDLTPGGRPNADEQLEYACCGGHGTARSAS